MDWLQLIYMENGAISIKEGKMVINNSYMTCGDFSEGLTLVQGFDKKYHYIDSTGKKIFDCLVKEIANFVGEFAVFAVNESFGVIDKKMPSFHLDFAI